MIETGELIQLGGLVVMCVVAYFAMYWAGRLFGFVMKLFVIWVILLQPLRRIDSRFPESTYQKMIDDAIYFFPKLWSHIGAEFQTAIVQADVIRFIALSVAVMVVAVPFTMGFAVSWLKLFSRFI